MTSRFAPKDGIDDPRKRRAGEEAASHVKDGMVVGLGTGSTVYYTTRLLGERIKDQELIVRAIPTSLDTRNYAKSLGIPLTDLEQDPEIDITIDGADEVDPQLNLIKGLGGALLMEKIVAAASKKEIIVADQGKIVPKLGRGKLPVEVLQFGFKSTFLKLEELNLNPTLRMAGPITPFLTDNNGFIVDCLPGEIEDPTKLERIINTVPGVVENGLFIGLADLIIIGDENGLEFMENK